ncbi:helix-turn-helix transcriptional regulator [Serratia marcescens]|uniref:XRE family transcriptional regulator n=1 Tax=Serratia marcescens TaxID=615 RepID=UPI001FB6B383|nr:helix-turn-helix transcriptional regulator [Serratia marcescens]MCW6023063.1 helix-turn-helix transcriptional regulator [Serratia marcescens]UOG72094.1 helix-turn-helix transcriptional regulator [Serratia marcescens]
MVQNEKVRQEFSQRLAQACREAGLDEHGRGMAIARALAVSSKGVSKWLNAESLPRQEKMNALAKFLKVDVVWLQHGMIQSSAGNGESVEYAGKVRPGLVPVVGDAVLGVDGMIDMVEYRGGWLKIYSDDPNAYGLRVQGDSMWPRIQSGEFVLIEPGTSVHSGDEVFVRTADGHNMIKVLNYTRDGGYQFTSINQDHRPITLPQSAVLKVEYVAGILKASRHVEDEEVNHSKL